MFKFLVYIFFWCTIAFQAIYSFLDIVFVQHIHFTNFKS